MALDYQGIYILGSGMLLQERKLDLTANNMANADTVGFKKDLMLVSTWRTPNNQPYAGMSPEDPAKNFLYPIVERTYTDLSQGVARDTQNPLDFAIEGEGFFAVRDGQGNVYYTRNGNFRLDKDGYLVNAQGYRVLSDSLQEIRIEGQVQAAKDGTLFVNGNLVARLGVFSLTNPQKVGDTLFVGTAAPATNYRILQGVLENSNVNIIQEMVNLIQAARAHEVYSNLIRSLDSLQEKVNNLPR